MSQPALNETVFSHQFDTSILRAYDIRGIYETTLHDADAYALGRAFAAKCAESQKTSSPKIAVGYDGRESSPSLKAALINGLVDGMAEVIEVGCGPTPMLYFAVHHLDLDGGVMVTGSHNPPTHNGFKLMCGKASFFGDAIAELGVVAANGLVEPDVKGSYREKDIKADYIATLAKALNDDGAKPLKVAFDPGNGAAGEITEKLVAALPGEHVVINAEIDGTFPNHHPDPTVPKNLEQLIDVVKAEGCDMGVAFDGDGDRIGAVDAQGRIIWGDQLLMLYARDVLTKHKGVTIIADVKASQSLFDVIAEEGGTPLMWKTGHSHIKTKMKELSAPLAGEMSGHIFFADHYFGFDDGLYAAMRLMNYVAHHEQSLTDMVDAFPKICSTTELRIDVDDAEKFAMIDRIQASLQNSDDDVNTVDGVRVTNDQGWWLIRASNTQAAIIVRVEAKDETALHGLCAKVEKTLASEGVTATIQ